ncbi:MAG: hypothetical protein C0519_15350 [Hyphomicrobium sp.]|nr:hypothetical protein [Hyphomicrobium sp.]PPD06856.1 MAG: hypothetical protein CTY28_11505 [Hyphomicrobium sp.]
MRVRFRNAKGCPAAGPDGEGEHPPNWAEAAHIAPADRRHDGTKVPQPAAKTQRREPPRQLLKRHIF